jgi:hypothetical protein
MVKCQNNKWINVAFARQLPLFVSYFNLRVNKEVAGLHEIQVAYKYSLIYVHEH